MIPVIFLLFVCLCSSTYTHAKKTHAKKNIFFTPQTRHLNKTKNSQTPTTRTQLSLHRAIKLAHKYKPDLQAYKHKIRSSKINEKLAWSDYYPVITLESNTSQSKDQSSPHTVTTLGARQLIYDFAGPQKKSKQAAKHTQVMKFQQQAKRNNTRLAVEQAFLDCWKLQQQYMTIKALQKASRTTLNAALNKNSAQLSDKKDWLKDLELHANDLATISNYDDAIAIFQDLLLFLMGNSTKIQLNPKDQKKNIVTKLTWDYTKKIKLQVLDFYYQQAIKSRPEIKEQQKYIEIQEDEMSIVANTRLPKLSAHANTGYTTGESRGRYTVGATISWNIFDGLKSNYLTDQAHAKKLEAILNKQQVIQSIKKEVEQTYHELNQELTKLNAQKFRYVRTKNDYVLACKRFKIGDISAVERDQAEYLWRSEQIKWINQKVATYAKNYELLHRCGYSDKIIV